MNNKEEHVSALTDLMRVPYECEKAGTALSRAGGSVNHLQARNAAWAPWDACRGLLDQIELATLRREHGGSVKNVCLKGISAVKLTSR